MRARAQPGLLPARLRYQRKPSAIGPRLAAENPHHRTMVPASTAGAEGDRLYTRTGQESPLLLLDACRLPRARSAEHTSELQSLMRISYAVFCLKKKTIMRSPHTQTPIHH